MEDSKLMARMAFVSTVLFGFYLLLVKIGLMVGLGLPSVVGGLVAFVAIQYWIGTRGAVRQVGAVDFPKEEFAAFYDEYKKRAKEMGFDDPPDLKITEMGSPNAFAVGRKGNGTIVVSIELLDLLDFDEAAAVTAHELAHLKNRDSILMVVGESVSTIIGLLVFLVFEATDSIILSIVGWVLASVAKFFVMLFVLALSRYREYAADRAAADTMDSGAPLATALRKIESNQEGQSGAVAANVSALCIIPSDTGLLESLLSTHPPTEKRVDRLESM